MTSVSFTAQELLDAGAAVDNEMHLGGWSRSDYQHKTIPAFDPLMLVIDALIFKDVKFE
jgi:hypothetical protein